MQRKLALTSLFLAPCVLPFVAFPSELPITPERQLSPRPSTGRSSVKKIRYDLRTIVGCWAVSVVVRCRVASAIHWPAFLHAHHSYYVRESSESSIWDCESRPQARLSHPRLPRVVGSLKSSPLFHYHSRQGTPKSPDTPGSSWTPVGSSAMPMSASARGMCINGGHKIPLYWSCTVCVKSILAVSGCRNTVYLTLPVFGHGL